MSTKRQATTELNHENWDDDDPSAHEEIGTFKAASKDVLEKRVIKTAKRRSQISMPSNEANKGVFSGFGGFNKTQPSSFDFLANLTNGNKTANGTSSTSTTSVTSSLFSNKPTITGSSGIFGSLVTSTPVNSAFGAQSSNPTSLFGGMKSVFSPLKADSTVKDSQIEIQPVSSSSDTIKTDVSKNTNSNFNSTTQVSSTIFGAPPVTKSLFASSTKNILPLKSDVTESLKTGQKTTISTNFTVKSNDSKIDQSKDEIEDKKLTYYSKLKDLNESVTEWITQHVKQTPLCILSPIFKDYEKYLNEIKEEYEGTKQSTNSKTEDKDEQSKPAIISLANDTSIEAVSTANTESTNVFNIPNVGSSKNLFGNINNSPAQEDKPTGFSFGINKSNTSTPKSTPEMLFGINNSNTVPSPSAGTTSSTSGTTFGFSKSNTSDTTTTTAGFLFGVSSTSTQSTTTTTASTGFSFATKTSQSPSATPFSFGIGKPFSFSPNIAQNTENNEQTTKDDNEDEPPKVEFTPLQEENSVYDKKCKIFVKKDNNFVDKGVSTLYIKKIEDSDNHQLLVRANTTLGNVLINLRLASAIPTQRMGKNNVMMICIPTPDSKPPPTTVLIRVKTAEEADELLETLNKYKT